MLAGLLLAGWPAMGLAGLQWGWLACNGAGWPAMGLAGLLLAGWPAMGLAGLLLAGWPAMGLAVVAHCSSDAAIVSSRANSCRVQTM